MKIIVINFYAEIFLELPENNRLSIHQTTLVNQGTDVEILCAVLFDFVIRLI